MRVMTRHTVLAVCGTAIAILLAALARPSQGQSLHSVVEPRARVFPTVGPGVTTLKRDASGHYYILAKPATVVSIYDPGGKLVGQIPNANSQGAKIRYAVDMDLSPDGHLFVADRGANAIDIFSPDGSIVARVPVVAPTSVVALTDGEFAVTTLTSKRLIQVMDEKGHLLRSFGDPIDVEEIAEEGSPAKPLNDWGKIVGSSAGDIYFAFTSLPDPLFRKYDRNGYVGYEASVPQNFFATGAATQTDRVEIRLNLTHVSLSEQTNGWISLGSSGDVKFGGGMGTGLSRVLGPGRSLGRAGMQPSMSQPGFGSTPGGVGGGTIGGTFTGQITDQGTQFQMGVGNIGSLRGGARGRRGGSATADQETDQEPPQSGSLQFFGSDNDATGESSTQELGFMAGDSSTQGKNNADNYGGTDISQDFGLSAAFFYGTLNSVTFQPPGAFGGIPGGIPGGGMRFQHQGPGGFGAGGSSGAHFGEAHFGPHGHFGAGESDLTATLRVNLGDLGRNSLDKAAVTATSVDPATGELWAGVGDALIRFSEDGNPIEIYYLTLKGGVPLKPSAVLVEPDRFLIAADPWGIFEFARVP